MDLLAYGITIGLLLYTITLRALIYYTYNSKNNAIRQTKAQNDPENTGNRLIDEMRDRLQQSYARTIDFNALLAYLRKLHSIAPADFAKLTTYQRRSLEKSIYFAELEYQRSAKSFSRKMFDTLANLYYWIIARTLNR